MVDDLEQLAVTSYRQARRVVIFVIGLSVILIGTAMLVLPGPGIVTILLGLAILAIEFAWARRWLRRLRTSTDDAREGLSKWFQRRS